MESDATSFGPKFPRQGEVKSLPGGGEGVRATPPRGDSLPISFDEENVSGAKSPVRVPVAAHESEPGHTFRLARSLQEDPPESEGGRKPLPDSTYIPVPDRVLDALDELSGCEARLCLLLIRASYGWADELGEFRASSRWHTPAQIEKQAGGLGMSRESLRRAAKSLEERGWVGRRARPGEATAYRWGLSVPKKRYTPVPAPLLHAHQGLSHSALVLFLCVVRATLGWAERDGDAVTYRPAALLTAKELRKMTGLSRPTLRDVQAELESKDALCVQREHRGAPYELGVDFSFIRAHLQNSYTPTSREESSNQHTPTREASPENARTKGQPEGRPRSQSSARRITESWERDAIRVLTGEKIGMDRGAARNLVICRSRKVVEGAIQAFRRRGGIHNPAGWMYKAIDETLFGPRTPDKNPDVRQSDAADPFAAALQEFQARTDEQEGWEWNAGSEPEGRGKSRVGSGQVGSNHAESDHAKSNSAKSDRAGRRPELDAEPTPGVTHAEMTELHVDALRQPPGDWEPVERRGQDPLFVPSRELANWAYRRLCKNGGKQPQGSERFRKAARKVVNVRARYEGKPSPLRSDK